MTLPLVSIITPTKNRLKLLTEALDSVAAQTCVEWEHIVVDDGSDDGTAELMACRTAADPRVRYIIRRTRVSGANVCRNIGVRSSRAALVILLDSDDLLAPDCLERRIRVMSRNLDLDFATFRAGFFETTPDRLLPGFQPLLGDDLCRFLYFETPWQTTAPIWRRESLINIGLFDESLLSWQDIELHVRAITAGLKYVRMPYIDYYFRYIVDLQKISYAQHYSEEHLNAAIKVIELLETHVRGGPGMDWVRQRALCSLYFFVAERWVERCEIRPALNAWQCMRKRDLGPVGLYGAGVAFLIMQAAGVPCGRLKHKWKGWARLRTNPELVPA